MSLKQAVLLDLFYLCEQRDNFIFDNNDVETVCRKHGFVNKFDVTKLDQIELLPQELRQRDYAVIHLGSGQHKFVQGISRIYHHFEPIVQNIDWHYQRSLLNKYNSSESNVLSVANNQRILHHFLFGLDREFSNLTIEKRPKTYFPHRTKMNLEYTIDNESVRLNNIQMEIDLTIEYDGHIGVFEAKVGQATSFSVYQLYHPFLYYYLAKEKIGAHIKSITGVYLTQQRNAPHLLNLWAYTFSQPKEMTSLHLIKSATYTLVESDQHAE
jgi:hypothetical protein